MNYKVYFENNTASHCEPVNDISETFIYGMLNHRRVIKSFVVSAQSEKDALEAGNKLITKFTVKNFYLLIETS